MPAIAQSASIIDNISRLIRGFHLFEVPMVFTEQYPKGLGETIEEVRLQAESAPVVEKIEFSATGCAQFWPTINPLLPSTFVVCGVETHVCVSQTVIGLLEKHMQVHVVADGVGSRHSLDHEIGLKKLERAGALLSTTEMCLFELAEKAGTETFKSIQQLVKNK
jgi:nicotinamidase-related amidase